MAKKKQSFGEYLASIKDKEVGFGGDWSSDEQKAHMVPLPGSHITRTSLIDGGGKRLKSTMEVCRKTEQSVVDFLDLYEKAGPREGSVISVDVDSEYQKKFHRALSVFGYLEFLYMVEGPLSERFLSIRNQRAASKPRESSKKYVWEWLDSNGAKYYNATHAAKALDAIKEDLEGLNKGFETLLGYARSWVKQPGKYWKKR